MTNLISTSRSLHALEFETETQVSSYDRWNAWLISLLMLVGFFVVGMFLIWMTSGFPSVGGPVPPWPTPTPIEEDGSGDEIIEPGAADMPELVQPQFAPDLAAVPQAVSNVLASISPNSGTDAATDRGLGIGGIPGPTPRRGEPHPVPEYKRWIIRYQSDSIESYAAQLSFFAIDIGVCHKTKEDIWRVHDPGGQPTVIDSNRTKEKRTLRFLHRHGKLIRWDEQLARRAEIDLEGCLTCQFIPEETRVKLREVEASAAAAAGRELKAIKSTVFKVVPSEKEYKLVVEELSFR